MAISAVIAKRRAHDDEAEAVILASIDRFLERDVAPYAHALEHDDIYPEDIVARMKELGLFGATIDTAYGGLGLSTTVYARIVERISRVWMSVTGIFNSHLIMAAAVQRFGTDAQKAAYLPRFATGELRGGLALTEPDCGTDLQAIRTVARRRGDIYRHQRHQDLDFERHPRPMLRASGQDQSRRRAAPQRHELVHRRKRRWL